MKQSFDDVAIDADENHQTNCSHDHEEMSMGSYCSDEEQMEDGDNDMDDSDSDSDSKSNGLNWEEEQFYEFGHEKDADSKVESLSESSHDMSVTWLDDILNSYYEDILVDQTLKETKLEENENQVDDVANCSMKKELDEEINDNIQCQNMSETCKVDEITEDIDKDIDNINSSENQIEFFDETEESITGVKDILEVVEKDEGKGKKLKSKSCIHDEEEETSEDWKSLIRRKKGVEDEDDNEMKSFNPREPNFLPLVPEEEGEKVDLKHQMMDERKNADEWMIDCALRQVVTKLAPARKKKVALLVEAFESVMPIQKFGSHLRNNSAFAHSRHIQACS